MPKPNKKLPFDLRSRARSYSASALATLHGIALRGESEAARVSAAIHLLDRGWGKAEQVHAGDISGDIRITIRQIVDGTLEREIAAAHAKVIEHDKSK